MPRRSEDFVEAVCAIEPLIAHTKCVRPDFASFYAYGAVHELAVHYV